MNHINAVRKREQSESIQFQITDGAFTVTIPLHVTVSLGSAQPTAPSGIARNAGLATRGEAALPRQQMLTESTGQFTAASLLASEFEWQTALSLAVASSLSYESGSTVESTARNQWGLEDCHFIDADDTQCFVAWSAQAVLVSFRGTESLGDWLSNLNMIGTTRPNYGRVHRGFLSAFQVVDAQLRSILAGVHDRPILLTGHSLGGALATIAAAEWQGQLPIAWVYTYGQPAVGKGIFPSFMAQHYAGKFMRFVNDDDIVPRVPPTYQHVGRLFHFDAEGELEDQLESAVGSISAVIPALAHSPAEPPMLTETEFDLLRAQILQQRAEARGIGLESSDEIMLEGLFPSVSDHSLDAYIAKIAAKVG
jgi:Lipase (class 3)